MSLAVFKDNYLKYANTKYFTSNAQLVTPGSVGEKADPAFGPGKLEPKDHLPARKLNGKVRVIGPITLDSVNSKKSDFAAAVGASLKVIGFSGSVGAVYDKLTHHELKLVQLWIEENDIKHAANTSPRVLDDLRDYGGDARIAHSLWVVAEAEWATSFSGSTRFEISADAAGIVSVKASGGTTVSGKDTLRLAPGMGLAYSMLKLNWGKGKTEIEDTDVDEPGLH